MKLFVSPHNDDAVLFGAFTLQREKCTVLTVYDSFVQVERGHKECMVAQRRGEDVEAMRILGCPIEFAGLNDAQLIDGAALVALSKYRDRVEEVWLPAFERNGHDQHNLVSRIGSLAFEGLKVHRYLTYTHKGKSTYGTVVRWTGSMLRKKLQALACYETQIEIDKLGCAEHFIRDQNEYVLPE